MPLPGGVLCALHPFVEGEGDKRTMICVCMCVGGGGVWGAFLIFFLPLGCLLGAKYRQLAILYKRGAFELCVFEVKTIS